MTLKRRLQDAEARLGLTEDVVHVIRLEYEDIGETHFVPVTNWAKERAERLCEKHGHTFKPGMIPQAIWEAAE